MCGLEVSGLWTDILRRELQQAKEILDDRGRETQDGMRVIIINVV